MQKYSKLIKELVEFINDLSITCSRCSTQLLTGICFVFSIRKIISFFQKSLTPLWYLCKLYR